MKATMKVTLKLLICFVAGALSLVAAGAVIQLLHLHPAQAPGNPTVRSMLILGVLSKIVLVVGLWPLARGLAGAAGSRAAAFFAFLALANGLNTIMEASIFTTILDHAVPAIAIMYLAEAILLGVALGFLFGRDERPPGLAHHDAPGWVLRGIAAWLAFPVIYLAFGMCVAPIVTPYYRAGIAGLHIPPMPTIVETQLVRSIVFLAVSLPLMALWKGTRRGLWLTLGLAHATVVGFYGLVGNAFLPGVLRTTHGIEITADSFAYAALLVWLFAPPSASVPEETTPEPGKQVEVHA